MSGDNARPSTSVLFEAGELRAELAPDIGGSVASFQISRDGRFVDLMRAMTDAAWAAGDPTGSAMFPMVPYANRIAGNRFHFEGQDYNFKKNYAHETLNVHGSGWLSRWDVRRLDRAIVELTLDHAEEGDPYTYRATQRFELTADGLTVTLKVINRGARRMPFGLGLHPWWRRDDCAALRFSASHFWLTGPDSVPTDRIATPTELDFSRARPLPKTWRNNAYGGWDGHAELFLSGGEIGLRIEADPIFRHILLYADPDQPVFCLEPQTNAVCAFNRLEENVEDLGIIFLSPGEHSEGTISFRPFVS